MFLSSTGSMASNALGVYKTRGLINSHLLTAETYSLMATDITNTGASSANRDVGSNAAAVSGTPITIGGASNFANAAITQAMAVAKAGSLYYQSLTAKAAMTADIVNTVFTAGAYFGPAACTQSNVIYFDAEGDPDAVFVLNFGAAYAPAASSSNVLLNGAQANNIYITAVGAISTGANSNGMGTIMCDAAVTLGAGSNLTGRVLAHSAALTMSTNVITTPT